MTGCKLLEAKQYKFFAKENFNWALFALTNFQNLLKCYELAILSWLANFRFLQFWTLSDISFIIPDLDYFQKRKKKKMLIQKVYTESKLIVLSILLPCNGIGVLSPLLSLSENTAIRVRTNSKNQLSLASTNKIILCNMRVRFPRFIELETLLIFNSVHSMHFNQKDSKEEN